MKFIWNSKKSRLRLRLLYLPYKRGGLRLPNMKWYYWSTQLHSAMFYFSTDSSPTPAWVNIEQMSIPNLPVKLYLYSADPKTLRGTIENPFLKNTIDIWYKAHQHIKDAPPVSCFSPIWGNAFFRAGKADGGFKIWARKGVQKIDLYIDGNLLTFAQLCQRYCIPKKHFFKYLQLKHFIISKHKQITSEPPLSHLENLVVLNQNGRRQISLFYTAILSHDSESTTDRLEAWKRDIQENIDETEWEKAYLRVQKQSINTRMKLLQYK